MNRRGLLRLAPVVLLGFAHATRAGARTGRNLVWMNLASRNAQAVDSTVKALFDGPDDDCWGAGSLVYMSKRPPGLTPQLVRQALLQRQPRAQQALRAILRRPFDEVDSFDGLIAYADKPQPRLLSLSVGGRLRSGWVLEANGEPAWQPSLCAVMPPISRKP